MGSYHTLELECDRFFKLTKSSWDSLSLEIIKQSTSDAGKYDVIAILLQEASALICTVTGESSLRVVKRIEENLPKKKIGSAYEKTIEKFYTNVIDALLESFDLKLLKAIILASPGQFREELYKRLMDLAVKDETKKFINENKYIELVEEVKDNGGSVQIFVTGTEKEVELSKLSGVAAILNFPIE